VERGNCVVTLLGGEQELRDEPKGKVDKKMSVCWEKENRSKKENGGKKRSGGVTTEKIRERGGGHLNTLSGGDLQFEKIPRKKGEKKWGTVGKGWGVVSR